MCVWFVQKSTIFDNLERTSVSSVQDTYVFGAYREKCYVTYVYLLLYTVVS